MEFDGRADSILQTFTPDGSQYMTYVEDHGTFDDWPREAFEAELRKHYGHLFETGASSRPFDPQTDDEPAAGG